MFTRGGKCRILPAFNGSELMRDSHSVSASNFFSKPGVMEILLGAIALLAYIGTALFGFVYDDEITIVRNLAVRSWHQVPAAFLSTSADVPLYRPLSAIWSSASYALFGLNPVGWHLTSVAFHLVVTLLVFRVAVLLLKDRGAAFIAALLFALHPVHVEAVAWLSAVGDVLMTLLLLAGMLAFLRYRDAGAKFSRLISLVLFALAMLAKEPAVVFPVLVLAYCWIFDSQNPAAGWRPRLSRAVGQSLPYFCLVAVYFTARAFALRHLHPAKAVPLAWKTMILTWPSVWWFDLRQLLFPVDSSEFYPLGYVTRIGIQSVVLPLLFVAIAVALIAVAIKRLPDAGPAKFACLWIVLPLLPTLYLRALTPNDFVHDRFLYLPSVGLVLLAAIAIRRFSLSFNRRRTMAVQASVVAVVAVAGMVGTVVHQLPWASSMLLYQNALRYVPNNSNVKDNFANTLLTAGQVDRAILLFREIVDSDPQFWRSNYNLGYAYYKVGRYAEAERALNRAVQIDPHDPDQFIYLAASQMHQDRLAEAKENAERAIERRPSSPAYRTVLAAIIAAQAAQDHSVSAKN